MYTKYIMYQHKFSETERGNNFIEFENKHNKDDILLRIFEAGRLCTCVSFVKHMNHFLQSSKKYSLSELALCKNSQFRANIG